MVASSILTQELHYCFYFRSKGLLSIASFLMIIIKTHIILSYHCQCIFRSYAIHLRLDLCKPSDIYVMYIQPWMFSSLGMCKRCGNLKMIACTKCKGVGVVRGGPFGFNLDHELYQLLGSGGSKEQSIPCTKCQARGHFSCPDCCKI